MELSHDAFISYSHSADGKLGPALERGLEKLAKPLLRRRVLDVFLDETSLTASPGLWPGIVQHLSGSQWFLLIASPASAQSVWCNKEILWWLENRSPERMLILLTEGEIVWDDNVKDFDWSRTTALSSSLSKRFADEPLYVDARWTRDRGDLSLANPRFRDVVVDIAAPLRGMRKDELDSADLRQLRRNRMFVRAGVIAIAIAGLIAVWQAIVANQQRKIAESERDKATTARLEAERQRDAALARLLAIRAEAAPSDLAILLAVESLNRTRFVETDTLLRRLIQTRPRTRASVRIPNAKSSDSFPIWTFGPKGTYFVAGGTTETVTVWQSATLKEVARFRQPHSTTAAFSPDESLLAVADTSKKRVVLYSVADGTSRILIEGLGEISSLAFSSDASLLAVGLWTNYGIGKQRNGHVVVDVRSGTQAGAARTMYTTGRVGFSPDGRYLATVDNRRTLALWDSVHGFASTAAKYEEVLQWDFDPASGSLLVLGRDRTLRVHSLGSFTAPVAWNLDGVDAFAISDDGARLATARNNVIEVRWRDSAAISRIPYAPSPPMQIAFVDNARKLLVKGGRGARLFQIYQAREIVSVDRQTSAWSPDGRLVATPEQSLDKTQSAQLWEAEGGEIVARMQHDGSVCTVSFDKEGRRLLTASQDRTARIWSVPDGRELARVTHGAPVTAAWFAPDAATAVSMGRGEGRRWHADEGKNIATLKYRPELQPYFGQVGGCDRNPGTVAAAFVEKDVTLAVATAGEQAEVWSFQSGARIMVVDHKMDEDPLSNRDNLRVAMSADGKVLVTMNINKDGPVRLWEVPGGKLIQKLHSLDDSIISTIKPSRWREPVSPDGRYVVKVGAYDRRAPVIREVNGDRPFVELVGQEGVNGTAFSPDGKYLAIAAADGSVRLLLWKPEDLAIEACRRIVRNFTSEEWENHVGVGEYRKPCPALPE